MKIIRTLAEWRAVRATIPNTAAIGFVPTMGCLHAGHLSLLKQARAANDYVVLSLFVNPTQFNDAKDYARYPRVLEHDIQLAEDEQVDFLFVPDDAELYPDNYAYQVVESIESQQMEGIARPGHFAGMLTIVLKLFLLVKPQQAYFGAKDYQQLLLVQGLVKAFFLDIRIIACPTVRESSGLPLSSRNSLLSIEEKKLAEQFAAIFKQITLPVTEIIRQLVAQGIQVEYVQEHNSRRFCAVKVGNVRLIDNRSLE